MQLSIIIPAYNEGATVGSVIDELYRVKFPDFVQDFEVIVVNDASTDNTQSEVQKKLSLYPGLSTVKNEINLGKGASVRRGLAAAKGDVLLIQDADLELWPSDIPSLLNAMHELKIEFVNGSRYMPGIVRPLSSFRRYMANRLFTLLTAIVVDVRITDMACGYKLIHRNLYNKITLTENRFAFEAELLIKALKIKKNNIAEVPVHYFPRNVNEGKKIKIWHVFRIFMAILKYGIFGK